MERRAERAARASLPRAPPPSVFLSRSQQRGGGGPVTRPPFSFRATPRARRVWDHCIAHHASRRGPPPAATDLGGEAGGRGRPHGAEGGHDFFFFWWRSEEERLQRKRNWRCETACLFVSFSFIVASRGGTSSSSTSWRSSSRSTSPCVTPPSRAAAPLRVRA